jgi:hypothetical protein
MSNPLKLRKGLITRKAFEQLPVLTNPSQVAYLKVRFYKVKTLYGWLIGDVKKAEFLVPMFTGS